jgi:hypothetical protein
MIRWMPTRREREPFRPSIITAVLGAVIVAGSLIQWVLFDLVGLVIG